MTDEKTMKVRYVRNADPANRTASVNLSGRPALDIGGVGDVTMAEYNTLVGSGVILALESSDEKSDAPESEPVDVVDSPGKRRRATEDKPEGISV